MKLKKAANILFLVGAIFAIVWAVGYLVGGIVTAVVGAVFALIRGDTIEEAPAQIEEK